MKHSKNFSVKTKTAAVILFAHLLCMSSSAQTPDQKAQDSIKAGSQASAALEDYLNGLATAVQQEKRTNAWATKKESELLKSYNAREGMAPRAVKSLDCRSSKCDVQLQIDPADSPQATAEQQIAVNRWISESQSCGFTISTKQGSQGTPTAVRIILDCTK